MRLTRFLAGLCAAALTLPALAEPATKRWVSAGGGLSEWVVALGGESALVGVDSTSQHPSSLKALPSIGYQRQLSAEGILALHPDLLLGSEEMGPPPVLEQLRGAGVRIETLSARADLATLASNLQRLGDLLGAPQRASQARTEFQRRLQAQAAWVDAARAKQATPGVLMLLGHAGASPMAAGRDTAATWLIGRAGGRNLTVHLGYKALSSEALLALDPDVVIFADRSLQGAAAREALLKHNPALAATRAARDGRLLSLDPTLLVGGLGPRVPAALAELANAFYPAGHALSATATSQP
ncbi:MAG: ABC transporter substrate-binding protein [Pseudomonas sp.]|uniref:heme/hemin ABC transporter substrate-binding protein n=1 Tax=Pseudomonas sp. TaxID=306 RepID=UPI0033953ADF